MVHNTKNQKFIISTLIFAISILVIIILTFSIDKDTNEKITDYIHSIGWQIEENPSEIAHYKIPAEFDSIFNAYNEIQKRAGFNLENFKGKNVTAYSYLVLNHNKSKDVLVYITILIYNGEIIGGEISSNEQPGFIYEITNTTDLISA